MRAKFLRFEESRVFDEIEIYRTSLPVAFALGATYEQHSRIAAVCGLITGYYQHARHAQTNTVHKWPKDWDERERKAGKK